MTADGPNPIRYFGDYVLLGEIARGGMGEVWFANQATLNRTVAIKLIRAELLGTPGAVQRFRIEAEAAARLNHPNIVRIFEVGEHEGRHFFSMEMFDEGSLADQIQAGRWRLDANNAFPLQQAVARLMATLAEAVHHAHLRMVIHRDIKPANVLMDPHRQPHLSDFGLAKLFDEVGGQALTRAIQGTPEYMAPEQAREGQVLITAAADVYSLGAVLYELLVGAPPLSGPNPLATLQKALREEPQPPTQRQPLADRDLEVICLKCLEKEPARRYANALALAEDLRRWLRGEPIQARSATAVEKLQKWCRRHPAIAGLVALLTISVVGGLVATGWQWRNAEAERRRLAAANVRLELQRAELLFDSGHPRRAIGHLAEALRENPFHRAAQERLVNALNERSFLVRALRSAGSEQTNPASWTYSSAFDLRLARSPAPEGERWLATATNQAEFEIAVWREATGARIRAWPAAHSNVLRSIAWSPDGRRLVSAAADGWARVWSTNLMAPVESLPHPAPVYHATFSSDGEWIVTACRDRQARIWKLAGPASPSASPMIHPDAVATARFSSNGARVVTTCDDRSVHLWGTNGAPAAEPLRFDRQPKDAWFGGDENFIFVRCADDRVVCLMATQPIPPRLTAIVGTASRGPRLPLAVRGLPSGLHADDIVSTNMSPDGRWLATASVDKTVRVWDARTFRPVTEPLVHEHPVNTVVFSPDGQRVATATARFHRVWDVDSGQPLCDWRAAVGPRGIFDLEFRNGGWTVWSSDGAEWPVQVADGRAPEWLIRIGSIVGREQWEPSTGGSDAGPSAVLPGLRNPPPADRLAAWARQWMRLPWRE